MSPNLSENIHLKIELKFFQSNLKNAFTFVLLVLQEGMRKYLIILGLVMMFFMSCHLQKTSIAFTANDSNSFIINGTPVSADHQLAKSVVAIYRNFSLGDDKVWIYSCTGTVLNRTQILTAAHCLFAISEVPPIAIDKEDLLVSFSVDTTPLSKQVPLETRLTLQDLEKKFVTRKIEKIKAVNGSWHAGAQGDVGVITLNQDAPVSALPVKFLTAKQVQQLPPTFDVQLMGYGVFSENPSIESEVLRTTMVQARVENSLLITDQTKGSGACIGDSGGPAFLELDNTYYQVGITHGPRSNDYVCNEEGEFLNPTYVQDFINTP